MANETAKFLSKYTPMRVIVLMSTFNGEKYIDEQVRSILDQLPPDGLLMVRDDGSCDGTVARTQAFGDARIQLLCGENLGFARSFLTLLSLTPSNADMVMFSDQDDIWLDGKIMRAWEHLKPYEAIPALYCSAQTLVDENLVQLKAATPWPHRPCFINALVENIVTGCTAALNQRAVTLLHRSGIPKGVHFHDWWIYLVISEFGVVVADDKPTILYRQHAKNQIGHGAGWLGRQMQIIKFLQKNDWVGIMLNQIFELHFYYGKQLDPKSTIFIKNYFRIEDGKVYPAWKIIFSTQRWRQGVVQDMAFRLIVFFYKIQFWPLPSKRMK